MLQNTSFCTYSRLPSNRQKTAPHKSWQDSFPLFILRDVNISFPQNAPSAQSRVSLPSASGVPMMAFKMNNDRQQADDFSMRQKLGVTDFNWRIGSYGFNSEDFITLGQVDWITYWKANKHFFFCCIGNFPLPGFPLTTLSMDKGQEGPMQFIPFPVSLSWMHICFIHQKPVLGGKEIASSYFELLRTECMKSSSVARVLEITAESGDSRADMYT